MTKKTLQEIIDQQREKSKISKKSDHQINTTISAYARASDPEWLKKITEINQTRIERYGEEYRQKISDAQIQRYKNMSEEDKEKLSKISKQHWENIEYRNRMMEYYSTPEHRDYISKRNKEIAQRPEMIDWYNKFNKEKRNNPEHVKRHQAGIDKRTKDPVWREIQAQRRKPLKTPHGIFDSLKQTVEVLSNKGIITTDSKTPAIALANKIRTLMKRNPDQWYYISKEEYRKLTKK
jgi:sulfur relay (sulfurtransferase) DsrC/TusE family protein